MTRPWQVVRERPAQPSRVTGLVIVDGLGALLRHAPACDPPPLPRRLIAGAAAYHEDSG
jgi:hypothetical protein